MLFTSVVLASGFLIYCFASMRNLFYFGLLTAITIAVAFLADLLLTPALMAIYSGRASWRGRCSSSCTTPCASAFRKTRSQSAVESASRWLA